jgi:hypothetical protein
MRRNLRQSFRDNSDCGWILCAIFTFIGFAVLGSVLVYYNYSTVCEDCRPGYTSTEINGVKSCANNINGTISSYVQCHVYYKEPGFGFGVFFLVICWIAIGAPLIIIIPE